jgi:lipopolysaccharide export system protein LptA
VIGTLTNIYGKPLAVYVNVTLNGETFAVKANSKGLVHIKTNELTPGTYAATISYGGNGNYNPSTATAQITVTKTDSVITAPGVSVPYKSTTNHTIATITNAYGKALAVYVNVTVNGETYVVRANYKGEVSISTANLARGTYDATISYKGNGNYNPSTVTTQITVDKGDTIISADDITVAYKDADGQLVATLTNANGKPLAVYVHVNFNGKDYDVLADSNGQITIPTKTLYPGEYTATITYNGNGNYNSTTATAKVTVEKADTVITAEDVTVETGDPDGKLVATLTNAYGNALASYVHVSLNG